MSMFSKQDYELINLGVCIKNQADRLDIEHDGVPLEGVVVRIAEAAIAARREAVRLLTAGVVAEEPEWGCRSRAHIMAERDHGAIVLVDAHDAAEHDCPSPAIVYRRKAGIWIDPAVNQEQETE